MKHVVTLKTDTLYLKTGGVTFEVKNDEYGVKEAIGKLKISNTSIEWFPKHTRGNGIKLQWKAFDKLMQEHNACDLKTE